MLKLQFFNKLMQYRHILKHIITKIKSRIADTADIHLKEGYIQVPNVYIAGIIRTSKYVLPT